MFPVGRTKVPQIPTRKALLVLDLQNDFVKPDGALFVRNTQEFLERVAAVAQSFRETGEVVWVQTVYDGFRPVVNRSLGREDVLVKDKPTQTDGDQDVVEDDKFPSPAGPPARRPQVSNDPEAFLSIPDDARIPRCCIPKSTGSQFPAPILSAIDPERDTVLVKSGYSAFETPSLVPSFRNKFVTEIYICGSLSNVSVYATVLDAVTHGLSVTLIEDCLGYRSFPRHVTAMRFLADVMGASGITSDELLQENDMEETERHSHVDNPPLRGDAADAGIEGDLGILNVHPELQHIRRSGEREGGNDDAERVYRTSKPRLKSRRHSLRKQQQTRSTQPDSPAAPDHPSERSKKPKNAASMPGLGPGDSIGEGDSRVVYDLPLPSDGFQLLRQEVNWQKMYHMSGQVPRLVAVQGAVQPDGSIPIYRHPADESPPLFPFSPTVDLIRQVVEELLGHPINHVLIQLYRDGQDKISEHSDKTLDIARGSFISNVSLGAQRAMTLRTKKSAKSESTTERQSQQVPLPHNSLFVLGETTNMKWLHGIRPDRRPNSTKTSEELAFNGERISLTFRQISTFVNPEADTIWGQGALSKNKENAGKIVHGESSETERMIRAFGQENQATEFNWDEYYGKGFDVVNFVTTVTAKLVLGGEEVDDLRVRLCLAENGVRYDVSELDELPSSATKMTSGDGPVFLDADGVVCVSGACDILTHVGKYRRAQDTPDPDTLLDGHVLSARLGAADEFLRQAKGTDKDLTPQLLFFESLLKERSYLPGQVFGIDDCALWPVLRYIVESKGETLEGKYPNLKTYYAKVGKRGCVRTVLAEMKM